MRHLAILLTVAALVTSCSPEEQATGSVSKCATDLYRSYNPKAMVQCVDVCIKCDHGTATTCSTSCTLKGAR
ncbi:hypothetical protein SAMN05444171_1223 [Bradyrhizobium lablabi]|jgi:hypothetical protein|uniref:Adenylosuccinate lyase n=2 Tax=Bradyrhizobium TaxID=374 RepID=A0ABY0Q6X2_9BRAD|nr:hypothetical protein SAMN05444163_5934 [Bradyrhizobium ottawaense]SEC35831.1 hypothetical protein SAMN05444171_1223 [Bradyrhizobium lablabi]SHK61776.1 hypothetical protein SAMN05444321_0062 [Bradyrhizobium lablabi]